MKAVPSKTQNVAKNVQQESKKGKDTPGKQQNNEKGVPKKSQENNVNGATKYNFHGNITCKGCNKQFKTYLDYVHKDHLKVTTPCWTEYCKEDD